VWRLLHDELLALLLLSSSLDNLKTLVEQITNEIYCMFSL